VIVCRISRGASWREELRVVRATTKLKGVAAIACMASRVASWRRELWVVRASWLVARGANTIRQHSPKFDFDLLGLSLTLQRS